MKNKNKNKTITQLETLPRHTEMIELIGRARTMKDRKRKLKSDKVGRKSKYRERD